MNDHLRDELLEAVWACREAGRRELACVLEMAHAEADRNAVEEMTRMGLLQIGPEDEVAFTEQGEAAALRIIRRHRLAERLFADVLGMNMEQIEKAACNFEHSVVPEVTEGLCTLLGHPHECPHGRPIPPGECCRERRQEVKQAVMPLAEVLCGRPGRVAYVRPQNHDRLHLLLSMGIAPGAHISVHQRTPVMVVTVEQSEFAIDREVAEDVYVWVEPEA
jgi:DtxR family Mn-dependent transcriptional regulator